MCLPLVFFAMVASCSETSSGDPSVTTVRQYDLVTAYPRSPSGVRTPSPAQPGSFEVDGEARRGLRVEGAAVIESAPVRLTPGSTLQVDLGVPDELWDKAGDGVEFSIYVQQTNSARTKIFSQFIDPKHEPRDRRWTPVRLPLIGYGAGEVSLVFETGPGPSGDGSFDAGVWADPLLVLPVAR